MIRKLYIAIIIKPFNFQKQGDPESYYELCNLVDKILFNITLDFEEFKKMYDNKE